MAVDTQSDGWDGRDADTALVHIASRMLREAGGDIPLARVARRGEQILEIDMVELAGQLTEIASRGDVGANSNGESGDGAGLLDVEATDDGREHITGARATLAGPEPDIVTEAFAADSTDDLSELPQFDDTHAAILEEAGYDTYNAVAEADPDALHDALVDGLRDRADRDDLTQVSLINNADQEALQDAGYLSFVDLALASAAELAHVGTITEAQADRIIEIAATQSPLPDEEAVAAAPDVAMTHLDVGPLLAKEAIQRYLDQEAASSPTATVTPTTGQTQPVGTPVAQSQPGIEASDPEAQYVSDIGSNEGDPVACGFLVLDDPDHPQVPKPETDPDAGPDALPVDADGRVVPPAVPTEPHLQLPVDELIAKALHKNNAVRLIGPRGSGKNYLLKYIHYKTNRAYVSVDADAGTGPEELFGPLTPDSNGVIEPEDAAVKQALLNGATVVINEFPVMDPGAAMAFHRFFNEGTLLIKHHGEIIEPHEDARVVITMNPPTVEYRDSEPMNSATRGRFLSYFVPYIQDPALETDALAAQINNPRHVVGEDTLRKIVEFAHATRGDDNDAWPTLSTRNLSILAENIDYGASPKAAVKNALHANANPNQNPRLALEALGNYL